MQVKIREFFYVSNLLSLLRVILVIPIIYLLQLDTPAANWLLIITGFIAIATDYFDGYFSRKLNQVTELGIILDPVADKISMAAILYALIIYRDFPVPLVVFLICRDLFIVIAAGIVIRKSGKPVMANFWGKVNTTVVAAAGFLFIFNLPQLLLNILLACSYFTIFSSGYLYAKMGPKAGSFSQPQKFLYWTILVILTAVMVWLVRDLAFFI